MRKVPFKFELGIFDEYSARKLAAESGITLDVLVEDVLASYFRRVGDKHLAKKNNNKPATKAS
jgi:hypothetical protein